MDNKQFLIVSLLVLGAYFLGNRTGARLQQTVNSETNNEDETAPILSNGQAYYNVTFQMGGNVFNPYAADYLPLFGLVGTRQTW